jgi:pyruvate formate lyase activating enzyme
MFVGGLQKTSLIDYPGKICAVIFTQGCNFNCPYCHNPELIPFKNESVIEQKALFDFLERRRGLLDAVTVTGGEPVLQHDLPCFLKDIKSLGYQVKLDTNGSNPLMLRTIISMGSVSYLAMDVKAPLSKYAYVTRKAVQAEDIASSIEIIKDSGVNYEFRTTVVRSQLSIEDILEIAHSIQGAQNYYLQKFIPSKTNDPTFMKEYTYSDEEFDNLKAKLEGLVDFCGLRL